jgi:excisionase family DNA binding protein
MVRMDATDFPDDLLKPSEAAVLLHCHVATVYRLVGRGLLRAWRRGLSRRLLVSRADALALLRPVPVAVTGGRVQPEKTRARELEDRRTREVLEAAGFRY